MHDKKQLKRSMVCLCICMVPFNNIIVYVMDQWDWFKFIPYTSPPFLLTSMRIFLTRTTKYITKGIRYMYVYVNFIKFPFYTFFKGVCLGIFSRRIFFISYLYVKRNGRHISLTKVVFKHVMAIYEYGILNKSKRWNLSDIKDQSKCFISYF